MSDAIKNLTEKVKGTAKVKAGEVLDDENLRKEGEAQRDKAENAEDARRLEEMAEEKQQKAAGYKGEQKAESQAD